MDAAERERLVDFIAADRVGIHGRAVCQICGELGSFRGLASAQGAHWLGEYVMTSHDHVPSRTHSYGDWHFSRLQKLLDRTPERTCEVCLRRVARERARKPHFYWLCPDCECDDLHRLVRRRYVEQYSDAELSRRARLIRNR